MNFNMPLDQCAVYNSPVSLSHDGFFCTYKPGQYVSIVVLHDSSAVLQAHSPPVSIIAASHVATVFAKQVAFQGGS